MIQRNDIINTMSFNPSMHGRLGNYWPEIRDQSILFSHVRCPISLLESEWRYELQKGSDDDYSSTHLPHDPIFNTSRVGSLPDIKSMLDYIQRKPSEQISINDWCDLIFDELASKTKEEREKILSVEFPIANDQETSFWYMANILYRPCFSIGMLNKQYNTLVRHFTKNALNFPPQYNQLPQMILTPTECLSDSMAAHITVNPWFRSFTKFSHIDKPIYADILNDVKALKINETSLTLTNDINLRLTPKNRIRYYKYAHRDYKLWTSVLKNSLDFVHIASTKAHF